MRKNSYTWLKISFSIFLVLIFILFSKSVISVSPSGANYTEVSSERALADTPQSIAAQAGNVTELNINGYSLTQSWQGYFGNITGTIQLADANDNVFYNWTTTNPQGEIYATNYSSVTWTNIQCLNFTATGNKTDDESSTRGATSLTGMNLTQFEAIYGINSSDVDGINETFNLIGAGTHDIFYTNSLEFSEGECRNTRIYSDAGFGESNRFEEILLYDPDNDVIVFTSLLEQDLLGFDSRTHDFEMMVLENGHETDTSITPYYFYMEIQ